MVSRSVTDLILDSVRREGFKPSADKANETDRNVL